MAQVQGSAQSMNGQLTQRSFGANPVAMSNRKVAMFSTVLLVAILCTTMLLPYLPGRFDAPAATFSFLIRVASYASLILTPVGLAWMISRQRSRLWHRVTLAIGGLIALVAALAAVAVNQLTIGTIVGTGGVAFIPPAIRRRTIGRATRRQETHFMAAGSLDLDLVRMRCLRPAAERRVLACGDLGFVVTRQREAGKGPVAEMVRHAG
ncbi:MAG: hypothetical protein HXY18_05310 [Bryobacteraceae bacterium]|nr:hypothetical protein [Bryobacteraceae bacterium]